MADIVDKATDWIEREFELRWANRQHSRRLPHNGRCHNCESLVKFPKIFCDNECAEEFDYVRAREEIRRQGRLT